MQHFTVYNVCCNIIAAVPEATTTTKRNKKKHNKNIKSRASYSNKNIIDDDDDIIAKKPIKCKPRKEFDFVAYKSCSSEWCNTKIEQKIYANLSELN